MLLKIITAQIIHLITLLLIVTTHIIYYLLLAQIMVHLYKVITFNKIALIIIASNSVQRDNIIKTCKIDAAIIKEVDKADNIIISADYV